jgi:hypothetical protein
VKKPTQMANTCWYDGPRAMYAAMSGRNYIYHPYLDAIEKYYREVSSIFSLKYCYENFVNQLNKNSLLELCNNPNILNVNFPDNFKEYLNKAIDSDERKKLLRTCLNIAIEKDNKTGINYLEQSLNKIEFEEGTKCLKSIGYANVADNLKVVNDNLEGDVKYCHGILIQQKNTIIEQMFTLLSIQDTTRPTSARELYDMLEKHGPLLVKGTFGIDSYVPNSAKNLKTINECQILGWDKDKYINDKDKTKHATIIVGVEVNESNSSYSRVYFLDPRQSLDPSEKHMQVYSVGFEKYKEKTKKIYFLKNYGLTEEIRNLEKNTSKKPSSGLASGFYSSNKKTKPIIFSIPAPTPNNKSNTSEVKTSPSPETKNSVLQRTATNT